MASSLNTRNRKVEYTSSKVRVYFNAVVAGLAMIFSVTTLATPLNVLLLIYYFGLSIVVTFLMFKIKVLLMSRMQEQLSTDGQIENQTHTKKWGSFLILLGAITLALILPVILVFVLEPAYWFVSFTSIVTGVSLSEIVLYLSADKVEKLSR